MAGFFAGTLCCEVIARYRPAALPAPTLIESLAVVMVGVWLTFAVGSYASFAAPFVFAAFVLAFAGGRGRLSRLLTNQPLQRLADWSFAIYMVHAIVLIFFLAVLHQLGRWTGHDLFITIRNPIADHAGARPMIEVLHPGSPAVLLLLAVAYGIGVLVATWSIHRVVEVPGRAAFARLARRLDAKSARSDASAIRGGLRTPPSTPGAPQGVRARPERA